MPANVETAVYANTPAWHREGIVLDTNGDKGLTVEVALKESGLDWEVEKSPIYAHLESGIEELTAGATVGEYLQTIGERYAVQRQTDGAVLGVVGKTWQPVQNHEGFEILADTMQVGPEFGMPMWIEAAGALDGGKKVWVLAHLDKDIQIAGEAYSSYLLFVNGHDGRTSVIACATDVRVVCQNTVDMAIGQAKNLKRVGDMKIGDRQVRVRHTTKAGERIKQVRHILGIRDLQLEALAKQGEWLVEQEMSDAQFNGFLEKLMPIPEDADDPSPARTMIVKRQDALRGHYFDRDNLASIRGTRWGAYNAVVEYADYGRETKHADSQLKAQWGLTNSGRVLKDSAFELLTSK